MATRTRPEISANTLHVDELVGRALSGHVRIPQFQRDIKWRAHDVRQLFDSIDRGFPIGTLLMWKKPAAAGVMSFGPKRVEVRATDDAWWVVDGQQRLTSLVAALHHPDPDPTRRDADRFVVYYDLLWSDGRGRDAPRGGGTASLPFMESESAGPDAEGDEPPESPTGTRPSGPFFRPNRLRRADDYSMPLAQVLDAASFQGWLLDFVQKTGRRDLIARASEVATRIRNYRVPVYVVETEDPETAREMFLRVNRAGRPLEVHEVFAALAPTGTPKAHSPEVIADRLGRLHGPIEPNVITRAALALLGDDVTRLPASLGSSAEHAPWMSRTEDAVDRALSAIRDFGVPHTRLLPHRVTPVVTLARFFDFFPDPSERNVRLLRRWLWRGFMSDGLNSDARTLRRAVVAVKKEQGEDAAVQALLKQVPTTIRFQLPERFDARMGAARLAMLILALEEPHAPSAGNLELWDTGADGTGDELGVADWLREHGARVFTRLNGNNNGPEARFLTPACSSGHLGEALRGWARSDLEHPALRSHLVDATGARSLLDGDLDAFFEARRRAMEARAASAFTAFGEPRHADRRALPALEGES